MMDLRLTTPVASEDHGHPFCGHDRCGALSEACGALDQSDVVHRLVVVWDVVDDALVRLGALVVVVYEEGFCVVFLF